MTEPGKVYLVGAGPGDPGLITVKGKRCIENADVIIYDYLASPALLKFSSNAAEMIYVGKKEGQHTLSQEGINDLIVEKAKAGNVVTRLKGGDPFIFGRGGEEAEVLHEQGIPFEIVPGVTSAIAAPAYAGIPLTHREFTSTVAFVTGHEDPLKASSSINWESLAKGVGTLVFLMGVKNLPKIVAQLTKHGMPQDTPIALVRWGTTTGQITVSGTLNTIVEIVRSAGLKAPAIIVVGEVVQLRKQIQWFELQPLFGKTIVVTRARPQASGLVKRLTGLGAQVLECPTIRICPPADWGPLDKAINHLDRYQWIVFTSVNGVKFFFRRLFEKGLDVRALSAMNTAAIGPATADALLRHGLKSDIIPESYRAESVVEAFRQVPVEGKNFFLPRAEEARSVLPDALKKRGAIIDDVTAYRTKQDRSEADTLISALNNETVDMITFTSSSTVKNFKALLPPERVFDLVDGVAIAAIGPITADTAKKLGFHVDLIADEYTIPGLCQALLAYYKK
jgi:uroporphyrinogen III methyltransferase/synthase